MSAVSAIDLLRDLENNRFGFFRQLKTVADIMMPKVMTVSVDQRVRDARQLFEKHPIRHAPLIDPENNEVLGIVSDRDLIRHMPRYLGTLVEGDNDHRALTTSLSQIMTRKPVRAQRETPLLEAVSLMLDNHIDCLLVYEKPTEIQGIVTTHDFLKMVLLYYRFCVRSDGSLVRLRLMDLERRLSAEEIFLHGGQTVRDVMTREVVTLTPDHTIGDALPLMQEKFVRHVPMVD